MNGSISQFLLRRIRAPLAMCFFVALGVDGEKAVDEIWVHGSKAT
jgi:hypothetical protein